MKNCFIKSLIILIALFAFSVLGIKNVEAACTPAISGDYTIVQPGCTFTNSTDGVMGTITVNANATFTISANQTIVYNKMTIIDKNTSSIWLNTTNAKLLKGTLYLTDKDGDHYPGTTIQYANTGLPSNPVLRSTLVETTVADCDDNNAGPCPATSPTAAAVSYSQINVGWSGSNTAAGPTPTNYDIYRCAGGFCTPTVLLTSVAFGTNSYNNTGLTGSTTYGYKIVARNSSGSLQSAATSIVYATTGVPNCNSGPSYGACSAACNGGTQTCTYTTFSGGGSCAQVSCGTPACNTQACVCNAGASWGGCSVGCGGGTQYCTYTTYSGGGGCTQSSCGSQSCNTQPCCTNGYLDYDKDGYGAGSYGCYLPSGSYNIVGNNTDLCDSDAGANPGQAGYFTTKNACGNYDWNSDGAQTCYCNGDPNWAWIQSGWTPAYGGYYSSRSCSGLIGSCSYIYITGSNYWTAASTANVGGSYKCGSTSTYWCAGACTTNCRCQASGNYSVKCH